MMHGAEGGANIPIEKELFRAKSVILWKVGAGWTAPLKSLGLHEFFNASFIILSVHSNIPW